MTPSQSTHIPGFVTREVGEGGFLHVRPEERRKTSHLKLTWIADLGPHNARRCLIPACLMRGTRAYPSQRLLNRRTEQLWGLSGTTSIDRWGQRHLVSLVAEFPDEGHLPGGETVFDEAIDFVDQLIHEPHLVDGYFSKDYVDSEILQHRRSIEGRIDNKSGWAYQRCLEEACFDEPWRYHQLGTIEDLDGVEPASLTALWKELKSHQPLHVHFSGNMPSGRVFESLQKLFRDNCATKDSLAGVQGIRAAAEPRQVTEFAKVQQANLVMSYRTMISNDHPLYEPLMVANGILGGFPHSRLFTQVREKESLCYSIHSQVDSNIGMMFITAGVDHDSVGKATDGISEQIDFVRGGEFSEEEYLMTLSALDSRLRMVQDSPAALADYDLRTRLSGKSPGLEDLRKRVAAVTRDDVVAALELVHPDVTFLLAPEEDS
ncbi:MAG: hypothetical protein CBC13_08995 [Planctomycetia bacterium TMED53]|nr:MAG: hypothetical protein CBC13_08995 [Planctomycetia bacterium TMED53]